MSTGGSRQFRDVPITECGGSAGVVVRVETRNPVKLGDIGRLWISIDNQYRRFCQKEGVSNYQSRIAVRAVRPGSVEVALVILGVGVVIGVTAFAKKFSNELFEELEGWRRWEQGDDDGNN